MPELDSDIVTPKPVLDTELGVSIVLPFTTDYQGTLEVFDNQKIELKMLQLMRERDSQIRALFRIITLPIRAALRNFKVVPADGDGGEAEFIYQVLSLPKHAGGMTVNLERFIAQALLALVDGYAAFEIVYQSPKVGPLKGKWTIRKMARRPQETLTFLSDKTGGFAGIRQRTTFNGRELDVPFYPPYVWYYAAQEEENPFYGRSYFVSAWYHFDAKTKLYFLMHLAAQFRAVQGRKGTMPANPDPKTKAEFKKGIENFGAAMAMLVPHGYEVDEFGSPSNAFDYVEAINHHNMMQAKLVLAQFIENAERDVMVDFSRQQDDFFVMALQSIMSELETLMDQHLLANLVVWNFGTDKFPQFKFAPLSDEQKSAIMSAFEKIMVATTVQLTPQFILELEKYVAEQMGLELDYEAIEEQIKEEQELEREASMAVQKATKATSEHTAAHPAPEPAKSNGNAPLSGVPGLTDIVQLTSLYTQLAELEEVSQTNGDEGD